MRHSNPLRSLTTLLLTTATFACATEHDDDATPRGALLFGLDEAELVEIHDRYLADEPIEITRARLTAPFDCAQYGDFCAQVGAEAAEDITARQVDLALDAVEADELETQTRAWIAEAAAAYEPEPSAIEFRGSGAWTTQTIGNYRMRVRNGITTPLAGQREAWTEAEVQHQDMFGWWKKKATQICVNAGTNEQWSHFYGGGVPDTWTMFESFNPANSCVADESSHTITTYHDRNNGYENSGLGVEYIIHANGCATASINSSNFSRCANEYLDTF